MPCTVAFLRAFSGVLTQLCPLKAMVISMAIEYSMEGMSRENQEPGIGSPVLRLPILHNLLIWQEEMTFPSYQPLHSIPVPLQEF